jgi:hypothetical protein
MQSWPCVGFLPHEHRAITCSLGNHALLHTQVLPFFQAYHGSMGRVAAFSSSITKIQRLKDCIQLFGQPYCDIAKHNGGFDISKSLPEFENLPHPSDATVLKFDSKGEYDFEASMAAKEKQAQAASV